MVDDDDDDDDDDDERIQESPAAKGDPLDNAKLYNCSKLKQTQQPLCSVSLDALGSATLFSEKKKNNPYPLVHLDPSCQSVAAIFLYERHTVQSLYLSHCCDHVHGVSHRQHPLLHGQLFFLRTAEDVHKLVDAVSEHVVYCRAV